MTVLVACETLLLILLSVLVAGLLRSHAEILRRLGPEEGADAPTGAGSRDDAEAGSPGPAGEGDPPAASRLGPDDQPQAGPAPDIAGTTLGSDAVQIGLGPGSPATLVAFLTSGCSGCAPLWRELPAAAGAPTLPMVERVVIVTHDAARESISRLAELAPPDLPLIMSSAAWADYRVPVSPYFLHVGRDGRIRGEGTAASLGQLARMLADAERDAALGERPADGRTDGPPGSRALRVERVLRDSGISPEHPSLRPTKSSSSTTQV